MSTKVIWLFQENVSRKDKATEPKKLLFMSGDAFQRNIPRIK